MLRQALSSLVTGLAVTAAMTALTACSSPSGGPEESGSPACSDVWVEGSTLPIDYDGCMDGESLVVSISDGAGAVHYDDRFFAKPGDVIRKGV